MMMAQPTQPVVVNGWDAAFCPNPVPKTLHIGGKTLEIAYAGFYLGGSSAFHVWTPAERKLLAQSGLRAMPIWVPTPGFDNPRQVGLQVADAMRAIGIPAGAKPWRQVMWDLETGIEPDPAWMETAANTLESRGYGSLIYGSVDGSRIFNEPARSGYIVAHYDGLAELYPHAYAVGKQYAAGISVPNTEVDLDVLNETVLAHLAPLPVL